MPDIKKAGNGGFSIASGIIIALLAVVIWVLSGWRNEVATMANQSNTMRSSISDHDGRLRVLEDRWKRIETDLGDIKMAVGVRSSRRE